jgi:polar amino acid transport system substrate-binding protein
MLKRMGLGLLLILLFISNTHAIGTTKKHTIRTNSPVLKKIIKRGVLKVGINPDFKPFSFLDAHKKRVGVDIEIATLLAKELGVKLQFVEPSAFSELMPMLNNGNIDIIIAGMTRNFERAKQIEFSTPYFYTGLFLLMNTQKLKKFEINYVNSYSDLVDKLKKNGRIGELVVAVTAKKSPSKIAPYYFPRAIIKDYQTNEEAANAVMTGEAHIMFHDEMFLESWMKEQDISTRKKIQILNRNVKSVHYCFAIQKENQDYLNLLNLFISELQSDNHYQKIIRKYFKDDFNSVF